MSIFKKFKRKNQLNDLKQTILYHERGRLPLIIQYLNLDNIIINDITLQNRDKYGGYLGYLTTTGFKGDIKKTIYIPVETSNPHKLFTKKYTWKTNWEIFLNYFYYPNYYYFNFNN